MKHSLNQWKLATTGEKIFYCLMMGSVSLFFGFVLWITVQPYQVYLNWLGSYPSKREAKNACDDWTWQSNSVVDNRNCELEFETNQYLGLSGRNSVVKKRFRF